MKQAIFVVSVLLLFNSCYEPDDYLPTNVNVDSLITGFSLSKSEIPADGASTIVITIELPLEAVEEKASVTCTVSAGSFAENNEKKITKKVSVVNDSGANRRIIRIPFKSAKSAANVVVEAEVLGYKKALEVTYINAFPESIKIETSSLNIPFAFENEVVFTTTLLRPIGTPSIGNFVDLTVYRDNGLPIGYFRNKINKSDENGKTDFIFTLGQDSLYVGELSVVANAMNNTVPVSKTIIIYANNN